MNQQSLWIDTWTDAVKALVDACGGPKRVGEYLRPDLPADDAGEWLLKTLKSNRREVMSAPQLIQLLMLGRRHSCDVLAAFVLDQAGYEPPKVLKLETEAQRVSAELAVVMDRVSREFQRFNRLQALNAEPGRP